MLPACPASRPQERPAAVPRQSCRVRLCAGKDRCPYLLLLPWQAGMLRQGEGTRGGTPCRAEQSALLASSERRALWRQPEIHHVVPGKAQVPAPRSAVAGAFGIRRLAFTRRRRDGDKPLRRTPRPSAKARSFRLKSTIFPQHPCPALVSRATGISACREGRPLSEPDGGIASLRCRQTWPELRFSIPWTNSAPMTDVWSVGILPAAKAGWKPTLRPT